MSLKNSRFIGWLAGMLLVGITQAHAASLDNLLRQKNDPMAGNRGGSVTVVEFFDYQCSYCGSMTPTIAAILRQNPDVRFVFKEYPIRGPESELASRAALAANMQGKYQAFNHALFKMSVVNQNNITKLARSLGMDVTKLLSDMRSNTVNDILKKNYNLGDDLNISGTPSFFVAPTNATQMSKVESIYGAASRRELESAIRKVS